ncbi:MAG TPA: glycerol-3-phosphate 1-O-acyltransferase PlsY [Gaiellaceae bacterium]|nr:glycerol-3-phosphate 1-O-acyltransferase PlsY [Gaiellaceae bacterium]
MIEAALILGGYLLGSMPFGYWVVRAAKGVDIRTVGSGNIGASNVWRTYGKGYGIPIVLLDIAKGFVPAAVATSVAGELFGVLAGAAAMLGHWRPLFLRFQRGGKMVASAGGAFLGVAPLVGAVGVGLWIGAFLVTRYASVASIATGLLLPIAAFLLGRPWPVVAFAAVSGLAVIVLHRANIARLRAGTETRFRLRRGDAAAG